MFICLQVTERDFKGKVNYFCMDKGQDTVELFGNSNKRHICSFSCSFVNLIIGVAQRHLHGVWVSIISATEIEE